MRWKTVGAALGLCGCLCACGGGSSGESGNPGGTPVPTPKSALALDTFSADCEDFLDYAAGALADELLSVYACFGDGLCPAFIGLEEDLTTDGGASAGDEIPDRVSETPTQEAGVDEADIVKADAHGHLYVLSGRTLRVVDAYPPESLANATLNSIALAGDADDYFHASDLFLDEPAARLVVQAGTYRAQRQRSVAIVFDVSEPLAPIEVARLSTDGWGLDARRIGHRLHRVSRFEPRRPDWLWSDPDLDALREQYHTASNAGESEQAEALRDELEAEIRARLALEGAEALLPRRYRESPSGTGDSEILGCDAISHPGVSVGLGLALIDSFDTDGSARDSVGVINNAYVVYGSTENLYLAQSSFGWFFDAMQTEETAIYRLAIGEQGPAAYRAVGTVAGSIIGRYALSEHEGHLRIASTESGFGPGQTQSSNRLSVLDAVADGSMDLSGSIVGIAPGESIRGVRMSGPRGFIVTFRQIDPLYAIDLSDPAAPRIRDELKLPGFSSYLMPLGQDWLLTIGRDGTDEGLTGAVAVQLFDVSDLGDIRSVASLTPDAGSGAYSYSAAEYDPHAFSYFADAANSPVPGRLAIPLQTWDEAQAFTGFLVLRVDPAGSGLTETGRISHDVLGDSGNWCGEQGGTADCAAFYRSVHPRRALFMQDAARTLLYTVSDAGLAASEAATPDALLAGRAWPPE